MSVSPDVGFQHEREPNSSAPPRLASRILERSTPEEEREFVLGDMAEEFEDRLQSGSGRARAGLWYWNQSVGHARRRLFQLLSAWLVRQRGTGGPGRLLPNWGRKRGDLMTDFMVDLKFAGRSFSRNPRFAAIVVFTLALGIGANTLIFSMINAVWLAPLPYGDPDAVVVVWGVNPELGVMMDQLSSLELAEFRARNQVFDGLAGHQYWDVNFTGVDEPRALIGYRVTGNLFDLLDVEPVVGRRFAASEKVPGGPNVVILSHRLWSALGSDSSIVGRQVRLNDVAHEVVGVMGAEFDYPKLRQFRGDLWVPVQLTEEQMLTGSGRGFIVIGRLRGGVTLEQAQADMDRVAMQLETERPETRAIGRRVTIERYGDQVMNMPGAAAVFLLLMVTVGFVLLIACANVANLLLARASSRHGEIAIRAALGAGRARLLRQLFTESILLALLGGAVGLGLAFWGGWLLAASLPRDVIRTGILGQQMIDTRMLGFTFFASLATGVLFGLAPAWRMTATDLQDALKGGGLQASAGVGRNRLRSLLVVSETALSILLLIVAGLVIKSFINILDVDPGFNKARLLTVRLALPEQSYGEADLQRRFFQELVERVEALPGVEAAATVNVLPLSTYNSSGGFSIAGRPAAEDSRALQAGRRMVTPDYFRAMEVPLVAGRGFTARDNADAAPVAMVTKGLADLHFAGDPLGERISFDGTWREIIGVVGDVRHMSLADRPFPDLYVPYDQKPGSVATVVVRTSADPAALAAVVRNEVWAVDPNMPVDDVNTMAEVVSSALLSSRLPATLMGGFAAIAVFLAAVGLYGVMAYLVSQRTREIGIHMAVGATSSSVIGMVIKRGLGLAVLGAVPGLLGAFAVGRLLGGILYGVDPADPWIFGGVTLGLGAVALLATAIPARKAARMGALEALRLQ